jgi:histidinol-phosphatase
VLDEFFEFAVNAAWQAGRLTLAHYQTGVAIQRKLDRSLVTEADRGAEELARSSAMMTSRRPIDGLWIR